MPIYGFYASSQSQAELAKLAGISRSTLSRLETGNGGTIDSLARIMRALDIEDRLLDIVPDAKLSPLDPRSDTGRARQRVRKPSASEPSEDWSWDDDVAAQCAFGTYPVTADASRRSITAVTPVRRVAPKKGDKGKKGGGKGKDKGKKGKDAKPSILKQSASGWHGPQGSWGANWGGSSSSSKGKK